MSNHKMRTRVVSTIAALTLCPTLALAQAGSSPGAGTGSGTQGSQSEGSQGSQGSQAAPDDQTQGSSPSQGSSTQGSSPSQGSSTSQAPGAQGAPSASPQGSSPGMTGAGSAQMSAQQSIDPSQIQKVFGTDATLIDLKSLNTEDVRQLQQTLQQRGHYKGELDGIVGPQTRAALRAVLAEQFALNQRLINQGQLTEQLASSVGIDAQGVSPVRGIDMESMGKPSQPGQRPSGSMGGSPSPSGSASPTTPSDPAGASPQSGTVTPTTPPEVEEEE